MSAAASSSTSALNSGSSRYKISVACINCKSRKCKCSGGKPCDACSRLGIECVYNANLDKRRKIHLARSRTESSLQKELLHRLLDIIRSGDDDIQRVVRDDSHVRTLAQRLGIEPPTPATASSNPNESQVWPLSHAWQPNLDDILDDVSQSEELTRRHAKPWQTGDSDVSEPEMDLDDRQSPSGDQSIQPTSSATAEQSPMTFDPRNQYRIFCPREHHDSRLNSLNIFGNLPSPLTQSLTTYGSTLENQQMFDFRIPEYLIQPLLFEEERCPMAAVYTDFRDYGRRQLAAGTPIEVVLGPPEVELDLFFRGRRLQDAHTPATWACEYLRLLKDFDVYVSLASIFTYARFMRVSLALLPEAMRPTPLQRLVPHHPGVDLPIFPEMRDGLIHDMRDYIVAAQTLGHSVNWPHGLDEAIDVHPETGAMTVSEAFAEHVCDLGNWSISQGFAAVFPELQGHYTIDEVKRIAISEVNIEEFLHRKGKEEVLEAPE